MCSQQTPISGSWPRRTTLVLLRVVRRTIQGRTHIGIAKSLDQKIPPRQDPQITSPSAPVNGFSGRGQLVGPFGSPVGPMVGADSPSVVVSATVAKLSSKRLFAAWLTSARRLRYPPLPYAGTPAWRFPSSDALAVWRKTVNSLRLIDRGFRGETTGIPCRTS